MTKLFVCPKCNAHDTLGRKIEIKTHIIAKVNDNDVIEIDNEYFDIDNVGLFTYFCMSCKHEMAEWDLEKYFKYACN